MNELIRKLSEQARKYARDYVADCKHYGYYMEHNEYDLQFEEKFAELIVEECISIGRETSKEIFKMSKKEGDIFEYESHGAEQVIDNIKEHFGVKE